MDQVLSQVMQGSANPISCVAIGRHTTGMIPGKVMAWSSRIIAQK
jgi:hypothetical protein